jgi:hypothetical protein
MRIVSDRETQIISKFWERLRETSDTHLDFSSAYQLYLYYYDPLKSILSNLLLPRHHPFAPVR